jgi:hypothetical protein
MGENCDTNESDNDTGWGFWAHQGKWILNTPNDGLLQQEDVVSVWTKQKTFTVKLLEGEMIKLDLEDFRWSELTTNLENTSNSLDKQMKKVITKRNKAGIHMLANCHCAI